MSNQIYANVDVVNFCFHENALKVVLWKRNKEPFIGELALPGLTMNANVEGDIIQDALDRVFNERLKVKPVFLDQVYSVSNKKRDERGASLSVVYMSISILGEKLDSSLEAVSYVDIESGKVELPFDHNEIITIAKERLVGKSTYSSLPILLLSQNSFTISELTSAYRASVWDGVQEITVRKRVEFLQRQGDIQLIGEQTGGKGRRKMIYSHNGTVHKFDRSILAK